MTTGALMPIFVRDGDHVTGTHFTRRRPAQRPDARARVSRNLAIAFSVSLFFHRPPTRFFRFRAYSRHFPVVLTGAALSC